MSLITLMFAIVCNSLVAWLLLPRLASGNRARPLFRAWFWLDEKGYLYGWVPIILGLLAWDYFILGEARPKVKSWVTRKLLTLVLVAGVAPNLPKWLPAGQPPDSFLATIGKYPGLPSTLAWVAVIFVVTLLCMNADTRDALLGHGRVLSVVCLGVLLLVLTMTLVGWSITF